MLGQAGLFWNKQRKKFYGNQLTQVHLKTAINIYMVGSKKVHYYNMST